MAEKAAAADKTDHAGVAERAGEQFQGSELHGFWCHQDHCQMSMRKIGGKFVVDTGTIRVWAARAGQMSGAAVIFRLTA